MKRRARRSGFTIVELLIVIVIIAVLAAITIVAYNGVQSRAKVTKVKSDIASVQRAIEAYNAIHGTYPITASALNPNWGTETGRTDSGCSLGTRNTNWVPGITTSLPQSNNATGASGHPGCFIYASDGREYVLSAWNMLSAPQTETMYRRLGFREMDDPTRAPFYLCNFAALGGNSGTYNIADDYYKHSITVSNVTSCNEAPPAGA